jgi:hypothetical protein
MLDNSIVQTNTATNEEIGADIFTSMKDKIIHVLTIYPKVSPTMLQVGIGTGISPDIWHPVIERLMIDGIVEKTQVSSPTPKGRSQVYTIISLKAKEA